MALWFTLKMNSESIAEVEAVRTSTDDTADWYHYKWKVQRLAALHQTTPLGVDTRDTVTGTLKHRYASGALRLMSAVLEAYYRNVAQYEYDHKHEAGGY